MDSSQTKPQPFDPKNVECLQKYDRLCQEAWDSLKLELMNVQPGDPKFRDMVSHVFNELGHRVTKIVTCLACATTDNPNMLLLKANLHLGVFLRLTEISVEKDVEEILSERQLRG